MIRPSPYPHRVSGAHFPRAVLPGRSAFRCFRETTGAFRGYGQTARKHRNLPASELRLIRIGFQQVDPAFGQTAEEKFLADGLSGRLADLGPEPWITHELRDPIAGVFDRVDQKAVFR